MLDTYFALILPAACICVVPIIISLYADEGRYLLLRPV